MEEKRPDIKVSVIVPMYNCARFLPDFFQDIQAQTLTDFEMICVIDGATDNTQEIVQQYATEDKRIRYFYKENEGAGTARNYGFKYAAGEYVIWIDADDRYSPDLLKEMVNAADAFMADEVMCLRETYNHQMKTKIQNQGFDRNSFPENTCVDPNTISGLFQKMGTGPTNRLYRKSFIEKNQLDYSNTRVANDVKFIFAAMSVAKRVIGVHKHLITVQRYINPDSITSNRGRHTEDVVLAFTELYQWLKEKNLFDRHKDSFYRLVINGIQYNAEFGLNNKYVEATVRYLNEEEPWASMSPDEIGKLFGSRFDLAKMQKQIRLLETRISENQIEGGSDPFVQVKKEKSRLEVFALIKAYSVGRYQRNFDEYKIKQLNKQLKNTKKQLKRAKSSWNYKIGSMITWLPKRIYYLFKIK